jgi:hypothetical protein
VKLRSGRKERKWKRRSRRKGLRREDGDEEVKEILRTEDTQDES